MASAISSLWPRLLQTSGWLANRNRRRSPRLIRRRGCPSSTGFTFNTVPFCSRLVNRPRADARPDLGHWEHFARGQFMKSRRCPTSRRQRPDRLRWPDQSASTRRKWIDNVGLGGDHPTEPDQLRVDFPKRASGSRCPWRPARGHRGPCRTPIRGSGSSQRSTNASPSLLLAPLRRCTPRPSWTARACGSDLLAGVTTERLGPITRAGHTLPSMMGRPVRALRWLGRDSSPVHCLPGTVDGPPLTAGWRLHRRDQACREWGWRCRLAACPVCRGVNCGRKRLARPRRLGRRRAR